MKKGQLALLAVAVAAVALIAVLRASPSKGAVDPGWLDEDPSGKVVYCSGEDVSHSQHRSVDDFNASKQSGTARAELLDDISPKADGQRAEYLRRIRSGGCDVVYLDVIYTPEFASRDLLYDMTPYLDADDLASSFDPSMMSTVRHGGKLWGVPKQLDGGVLYYRRDRVKPPRTWKKLTVDAEPRSGELSRLRFQLDAYEGLTVTLLELAYAAGADPIVSADGKRANIDQPEMLAALQLMQAAIRRRAIPRAVTNQGDSGSLWAFGVGRALFLRSWPYVEARLRADGKRRDRAGRPAAPARRRTAHNLGVVPLPPWTAHGRRVGILGGHNLVIPRSAKNPKGALSLIRFLTSEDQILRDARQASLAPVLPDLWDHEDVRASPALMAVHDEELRVRPVIPSYARVSRAIYTPLRLALRNEQASATLHDELRDIQVAVQDELDGR